MRAEKNVSTYINAYAWPSTHQLFMYVSLKKKRTKAVKINTNC